jgi:hypothetical protein
MKKTPVNVFTLNPTKNSKGGGKNPLFTSTKVMKTGKKKKKLDDIWSKIV